MRSRRTNTVFVVIALLVALVGLPAFDGWSMGSRVPTVGLQAEDFSLIDLEGKSQSLSQYRGKIVLVNWATWCKPCTTEMPAMQKIYDKLRDKGFVVPRRQRIGGRRQSARAHQAIRPHISGPDGSRQQGGESVAVFSYPVSVFIDQEGRVQGVHQRRAADRTEDR
jgi:thiol-disulfide isomerase/thioredoxin